MSRSNKEMYEMRSPHDIFKQIMLIHDKKNGMYRQQNFQELKNVKDTPANIVYVVVKPKAAKTTNDFLNNTLYANTSVKKKADATAQANELPASKAAPKAASKSAPKALVEPKAASKALVEPKAASKAPVEPVPSVAPKAASKAVPSVAPVEPAPVEPAPVEPAPVEPAPKYKEGQTVKYYTYRTSNAAQLENRFDGDNDLKDTNTGVIKKVTPMEKSYKYDIQNSLIIKVDEDGTQKPEEENTELKTSIPEKEISEVVEENADTLSIEKDIKRELENLYNSIQEKSDEEVTKKLLELGVLAKKIDKYTFAFGQPERQAIYDNKFYIFASGFRNRKNELIVINDTVDSIEFKEPNKITVHYNKTAPKYKLFGAEEDIPTFLQNFLDLEKYAFTKNNINSLQAKMKGGRKTRRIQRRNKVTRRNKGGKKRKNTMKRRKHKTYKKQKAF